MTMEKAIHQCGKWVNDLLAANKRIEELEGLISQSIRISDLWRPPDFSDIPERHQGEYQALELMYQSFKKSLE